MIDHTGINTAHPKLSREFYEKALAPLGYKVVKDLPHEITGGIMVLGFGVPPLPDFWVIEGEPSKPHMHIAFRAETRKQVDEFYKAALAAGGKDNGAPGPRPHYHEDYYGAFVFDLDGNNIEAVCRQPG
jgi:catechol 2,3-dioxygenase-like lactoylglutathione lyase family enzyme